jgi:hypothetical protein
MDRTLVDVDDISAANNNDDFGEFLDKVGKKAEENRMTEEVLNDLLSEE